MTQSEKVIEKIKEILDNPLRVSQNAFTFSEIVTGELVYVGMAEFRDAITHISRALWTDDEDEALRDIDEAFEHIRRAGVESIQWAAAKRFKEVKKIIETPSFIFRLIFFKKKKEILEIEREVRKLLVEGREKKSNKKKWTEAILAYKEAIELTDKIYELCPTKVEYYWRIFVVITGLVTLSGFILTLYMFFIQ